jgi:hypothetical protein
VAVMLRLRLPAFVELFGPPDIRVRIPSMLILGNMVMVVTLLVTETALGLVADPRRRDFPYGEMAMAVVAIWTVRLLNPPRADTSRYSEAIFANLLVAAALFISCHEGLHNWQALLTSAACVALGMALWSPRRTVVASALSGVRTMFSRHLANGWKTIESAADVSLARLIPPADAPPASRQRLSQQAERDT